MPRSGKPLTRKQMAAFVKVSTPAKRLFTRLMEGKYYVARFDAESKYWRELQDAGLVVKGGRVCTIRAMYVPAGTKPFVCETIPVWPSHGEPRGGVTP